MNLSAQHDNDRRWMRAALAEARKAEGRTGENPPVGCVLVSRENYLIATGHTNDAGRPHAEAVALAAAKKAGCAEYLKGATAYVTLEPCAHHGQTPPCAEALRDTGIARLVYALDDPDERVNGKGLACLRAAGVEISPPLMSEDASFITSGFVSSILKNRPFFTSKIASSSDGFIAKHQNQQYWLTGDVSRRFVHDLRSRVDAIITGIGTILADDPLMTCRIPSVGWQPHRIILDRGARLPLSSRLVRSTSVSPVVLVHGDGAGEADVRALCAAGVDTIRVAGDQILGELASTLAQRGYQHVLIEAGTKINNSFHEAGLIDRIYWLKSREILKDGVPAFSAGQEAEGINSDTTMDFEPSETYVKTWERELGEDQLTCWHPRFYPLC